MDSIGDREEKQSERSRLNMEHGFMRIIRKNQLDRDQYDKEVKQKEAEQKSFAKHSKKSSNKKDKKPEIPIYVPPHRKSDATTANSSSTFSPTSTEAKILFRLEFEDELGRLHDIIVHENENPQELAKNLGKTASLSRSTVNALFDRLASEIQRRTTGSS